MKFSRLRQRVERGEALVEGRIRQVGERREQLDRQWRQAWSPLRIVLAGFATGFLSGRAQPEKMLKKIGSIGGPQTLRMVTSIAGLVGSLQAAIAAITAKQAADTADEASSAAASAASGGTPAGAGVETGGDGPATGSAGGAAGDPARADAGTARRRRPEQQWDHQPSPAEAATEISER